MAAKKNTVQTVREIAGPIADALGVILWDVKFLKEGQRRVLRLIIDKPGGVGMSDCVEVSRAVEAELDRLDPIEQSYSLQVQSPGLERELTRPEHFERYVGAKVKLRLPKAITGRREFSGVLEKYDEAAGTIVLSPDVPLAEDAPETAGGVLAVELRNTSWVRLDDSDDFVPPSAD